MKYRRLGSTGLLVSEIGFGAWGIGGNTHGAVAYGPTDDCTSRAALHRAYELGITFYDTSDFYGYGHSEELLGEALKDVRSQVVIATKVGLLQSGDHDFSPSYITRAVEASLKRLQTDYIDLYQLHSPALAMLSQNNAVLPTLQALQTAGKIRAYAISVRSPADGLTAITRFGFKALQVNFNLTDQRALDNGLFALSQQHDVGLIIRTPLCFGFLTGAYSAQTQFDPHDHRSQWSPEQITRWASAYQVFASAFTQPAQQKHAQIALRYCLSYPMISTTIPGMMKPVEVEENVVASDLGTLTASELSTAEQIYRTHTFFVRSSP